MALKLGITWQTRTWHIYAHARVHDLDLDARSPWLGRGKIAALNCVENYQASNK